MTYGYLAHHGVKGMRWGIRNYQNADGTLTAEGRQRYGLNRSASDVYAKRGILSKKAAQNYDYSKNVARVRRDVIKQDLKAFKKGGGGFKQVMQNKKAGNQIIKQIEKGMDEKYGEGAAKKIKTREALNKAAAVAVVTAISGIALTQAMSKYSSSGKEPTNTAVKGVWDVPIRNNTYKDGPIGWNKTRNSNGKLEYEGLPFKRMLTKSDVTKHYGTSKSFVSKKYPDLDAYIAKNYKGK